MPTPDDPELADWIRWCTLVLVATVPVLSGVKRGLPVPGFRLSELLTVGLAGLILLARGRRSLTRLGLLDWLALAYAAATLILGSIDLLRRDASFTSDDVSGLVGPIQYVVLYRAVTVTAGATAMRRDVVRVLLLASVPVAILALLQSLELDPFVNFGVHLTGSDYRPIFDAQGFVRATGTFPHWQVAAGYFLAIGLLCVAALTRERAGVLPRWALLLILALVGVALLRTVTTGASAALAVGGFLLALASGQLRRPTAWVPVALLLALIVAGSVFAPRYNEQYDSGASQGAKAHGIVPRTIVFRYDIWKDQFLPVLEDRWLAGYGPDLPPDAHWKYTESVYVTMLLRGGVLLLALYIAFMVALAIRARRLVRDGPPVDVVIGSAVVAIVLVLAVTQIIATYFTTSGTPQVVWILAALVAAAGSARAARGRADVPTPSPATVGHEGTVTPGRPR